MHRYTLEPYKGPASRYTCPECNRKRTFSRYIDTQTGNHIAGHVGRCSREDRCGYHFKPGEYLGKKSIVDSQWTMVKKGKSIVDRPWTMVEKKNRKYPPTPNYEPSTMDYGLKTPSTIEYGLFARSLTAYQYNNFVNWLVKLFGEDVTAGLIGKYLIGTSKHWPGATIFWQVDENGKIRTGKIMLYGNDGKRVKKPFNHITWAHILMRNAKCGLRNENKDTSAFGTPHSDFNLRQCLFGEHLLKERPDTPLAIVESEKSAIIASVYLPQFIWLAAGSLNNINADKCAVLKGRNVTLFPDLNCFDKWQRKAKEIGMGFKTSALLENNATDAERTAGQDIADYLLKFDSKAFESKKTKAERPKDNDQAINESYAISNPQQIINLFADSFKCDASHLQDRVERIYKRPVWDSEIDELQTYFKSVELPDGPICLNNCSVINDVSLFVKNHLEMVSHNNGNGWHKVYLERLRELRNILMNQINNHGIFSFQ
jgi:hypothetical protein